MTLKPYSLLFAICAVVAAIVAAPAAAIVEPRDCGRTTIAGKRYQIKADGIRCTTAKDWSRRYIRSKRKPSGWTCKRYGAETKMKFRCNRGTTKTFFAIKR